MLRAKSSLGFGQNEGDCADKSNGISGKNSLMSEVYVNVPERQSLNPWPKFKTASQAISPVFGPHKTRKQKGNLLLLSKHIDS